ncbi:MAG: hypothetical protein HYX68_09920 [Planctomycetes bacterium]|nr:hypothetical protein [Planctomycetota bacterium]
MTTRSIAAWLVALLALAGGFSPLNAQPTKLPTADEVKALQAKFRQEREKAVKSGVAGRFIPVILEKADELAKKSDVALAAGRLLQAGEAIRQARWQLPYQPSGVPEHVARIIGNLRLRHNREINRLAFSPDGQRLASASDDGTVRIWDLGNGHEILVFSGHTGKVQCVAWSPDGKFIASAGMEKNIKIWNADTGKEIHSLAAVGENVRSLTLSRNGKHLITGQSGVPGNPSHGLFVYDTAKGTLVRSLRDFTNAVGALRFNTEGNILAAGDDNGNVRLFQYPTFVDNINQPAYWSQQDPTGATLHLAFSPDDKTFVRVGPLGVKLYATPRAGDPFRIATPRIALNVNGPRCAVYSKDGKTLFTGGLDGYIHSWDPDSGQKLGEIKNAHASPINTLVFSPGGNRLASCSGDFTIRLWDFDIVMQARDFEGPTAPIWSAAISPDGTRIAAGGADRTLKVWQRDTNKVLFTITDHTAPVTVVLFSPDGKLIASAGGDKIIRIFDADTGKPIRTCEGHQGTITSLDFSADGKRLVSGSVDRRVKIWDADKGTEIASFNEHPSIVAAVAFHPNGKQIAVGSIDQTIRLYDDKGKLETTWSAHGTSVNSLAYSPNGVYLASGGVDGAVQIWPLATPGTNNIRLSGHEGPVSSVAFRKDNLHVVSGGADRSVRLWKVEGNAGKEVQKFNGHKDWVTSVVFSRDGFHVVSSSVDKRVKIWEITSRELPLLAEHLSSVQTVAVSPDGKYIVSGSSDRTIKVWDRATGAEVATLTGHPGAVMSIAFMPDSKRFVTSGTDMSIRFWEINPPREIPRTQQQLNTFDRLRYRYSPYIFVEPAGSIVYVWQPVNQPTVSTYVEGFDILTGFRRTGFTETARKINSLAFCANGKLAATGAKDGSVRIWDLKANFANVAPGGDWFLFDKIGVADLALTPDGLTLIATSDKGEIKIGKLQGKQVLKTIQGHTDRILACMVSPDGKKFATVGADNLVKAWDMEGKELRRWYVGNHQGLFVNAIVFTHDSRQIVTANANTTVYVLDLP